jgi:hypothetical protein
MLNKIQLVIKSQCAQKAGVFTLAVLMIFAIPVLVQAQSEWNFDDNTFQGWSVNGDFGSGSVSMEQSLTGDYSIAFSNISTASDAFLDFFDPVNNADVTAGQWINYRIYIPEGELANINEVAPYHNHGADFGSGTFEQRVYLRGDLSEGEWITVSGQLVNSFSADNLLVMGLVLRGDGEAATPTIYVDNITVTDEEPVATSNETEGIETPGQISLMANYPNPFNPTTQIPFELNQPTNLTLEVFDIMGRKINVLIDNEVYGAGIHNVTFDASALSSGVYLYRMSTPNFKQTRKLNLIK